MLHSLEHFIKREVIVETDGHKVSGVLVHYESAKDLSAKLIIKTENGFTVIKKWDKIINLNTWRHRKSKFPP